MTEEKKNDSKSLLVDIKDSAHKIWLAGLGAYAQYEKLGQEGVKLFENLVKDGQEVEDRTSAKVEEVKGKLKANTTDKLETRIKELKEKLPKLRKPAAPREDIAELSQQIEELSVIVKAMGNKKVSTTASRKSSSTASA